MAESSLIILLCSVVSVLFGLLMALLGWGGSKVIGRLDAVVDKLEKMAGELHEKINKIDTRLVRVETIVEDTQK